MKKWRAAESCPVCGKRWVPINERLRQFHSIIIKFPPKKKISNAYDNLPAPQDNQDHLLPKPFKTFSVGKRKLDDKK